MKLALRYIPTEVWVDVLRYPWISRKDLGRICAIQKSQILGIFAILLARLGKANTGQGLFKRGCFPRAPLPDNIKSYKCITISPLYVNLDFLGLPDLTNIRIVFEYLAPLLHGIHSLSFDHDAIPLVEQYFGPKLAQIKMLATNFPPDEQFDQATIQAVIAFSLNWLTSGGQDPNDEPKFLVIYTGESFFQLSMAIKEQFLTAKRPHTFAVRRCCDIDEDNIDHNFKLDLENNIGEQLHGEFYPVGHCVHFRIHRHQPNAGTVLQEWVEETEGKYRTNNIDNSECLTIGPLDADANAGANEIDDAWEEEADGPSTSKKSKLG